MNPIGITSNFFRISTEANWESVAEAGFENTEIVFMAEKGDEMLEEAQLRRKHAIACGLHIGSVHLPFNFDYDYSCLDPQKRKYALEQQRRYIQISAEWGVPIAVLHASSEPVMDSERKERFAHAADGLADLSAVATSAGIVLALEVLPRTCIGNTSSELQILTKNGTLTKVNMDFNHLMRETQMEFIDKMAEHIVTTHLSDYDLIIEHHWAPGVGKIQWKSCLDHMIDLGYTGQFLIEVHEEFAIPGKKATPKDIMDLFLAARNGDKDQ